MPLVVQTHTEELPVTSETFVELQCTGSGNPSPTLTWQKVDSSPLNSDPSKYIMLPNGNLIITGFNSETDTGYYVCNGTNTQGTAGDYTLGGSKLTIPYTKFDNLSYLRNHSIMNCETLLLSIPHVKIKIMDKINGRYISLIKQFFLRIQI